MESTFTSQRCFVLRRNPRAIAATAALTVGSAVVGLLAGNVDLTLSGVGAALGVPRAVVVTLLVVPSAIGLYLTVTGRLFARRTGGTLHAGPEGVFLDGVRIAAASSIASGFARPHQRFWSRRQLKVSLLGPGAETAAEIVVPGETEAQELLAALGFEPGRFAAVYVMPSHLMGNRWVLAALWAIPMLSFVPALVVASAVPALLGFGPGHVVSGALTFCILASPLPIAVLAWRASRMTLHVGSDGLRVRSHGRERFLPYSGVSRVRRWEGRADGGTAVVSEGLDVVVRGGGLIRLFTLPLRRRRDDVAPDFVAQEIETALEAHSRASVPPDPSLDRAGRTVGAWLQALRAMAPAGQDAYRAPARRADDLWSMLECPSAQREERAAAAVVLGLLTREQGAARLLRLARTLADRSLRELVQAAAHGDDAAVDAALGSLVRDPHGRGEEV